MARNMIANSQFRSLVRTAARLAAVLAFAGLTAACGGRDMSAKNDSAPRSGPQDKFDPNSDDTLFGEGGLSIGNVNNSNVGGIFGGGGDEKARLPVNKYLWQGALDTLSFLPLVSSDPFTGVIATDWGSTPDAPGERLKVTAYLLNPGLSAASLKVAVYREIRNEDGLWTPAPVSAETALKIENAILARARQIRIAGLDGGASG